MISSMCILDKRPVWSLAVVGDSAAHAHSQAINAPSLLVGRAPDATFRINSPRVSKHHARIIQQGRQLLVSDLNSTNGTFVNGNRITVETRLKAGDLLQFGDIAFRVMQEIAELAQTINSDHCDDALALSQFDRLIAERAVVPFFQPIVTANGARTIGYEVLGRSRLYGLTSPHEMFRIAAQLHMESELSRLFRSAGILESSQVQRPHVFLNTHPRELQDVESLIRSLRDIRNTNPAQPITLEIHESAAADQRGMQLLSAALHQLQIGLAYDDFGAGQSRLIELANVPPDYVKFDMGLVQGICEASKQKQAMLAALVRMTRELGAIPLAEGIESMEDGIVCHQLGFELLQGYQYGRPLEASRYLIGQRTL